MRGMLVWVVLVSMPVAAMGDTRVVWKYSGSRGESWFVHNGGKKWINYSGTVESLLYKEEQRTRDYIVLRCPESGIHVRLRNKGGELKKSTDGPWKRWNAKEGYWVNRRELPSRAVDDFEGYQIRVAYLVPSDRDPVADYEEKIRVVMAYVEKLYTAGLEARGYRIDRLPFERQGSTVRVRLVRADLPASHFTAGDTNGGGIQLKRISNYLREKVYDPKLCTTAIFAETYDEGPSEYAWPGHIGRGGAYPPDGGIAAYSAWILRDEFCATSVEEQKARFFDTTPVVGRRSFATKGPNSPVFEFVENGIGGMAHELGHALGIGHDYRESGVNIMGGGFRNIRFNFDPGASDTKHVGFSADNARLLMASRYLAKDLDLDDFDPPKVELSLGRTQSGNVRATIRLEDGESGLRAINIARRTGEATKVIAGRGLRGRKQVIEEELDVPGAEDSQSIACRVTDNGGNMTVIEETLPEASYTRAPISQDDQPDASESRTAGLRTWTSGSYSTDAVYAGFIGENVRLRKTDGRVVTVPVSIFSEADRDYLKQFR